MALYVSDYCLQLAARSIVSQPITILIHNGSPGNDGQSNRIANINRIIAPNDWEILSQGIARTTANLVFEVLHPTQDTQVSAYSLYHGTDFIGWADLVGAPVIIPANIVFIINAGTIEIRFNRLLR